MRHVQQPQGSNLCGQACVAMLLGLTLEQAIERVGKSGKTRTRDVVAALGPVASEARLVPVRQRSVSQRALGKLTVAKNRSHWVIFWDGDVYDPELEKPYPQLIWEAYISDFGARLTSSLPTHGHQVGH